MLKYQGEYGLIVLSKLFGWIYHKGICPSSWKKALIIPIPKKGNLSKIENYRPISITEVPRKVFDQCITMAIKSQLKKPLSINQGV